MAPLSKLIASLLCIMRVLLSVDSITFNSVFIVYQVCLNHPLYDSSNLVWLGPQAQVLIMECWSRDIAAQSKQLIFIQAIPNEARSFTHLLVADWIAIFVVQDSSSMKSKHAEFLPCLVDLISRAGGGVGLTNFRQNPVKRCSNKHAWLELRRKTDSSFCWGRQAITVMQADAVQMSTH